MRFTTGGDFERILATVFDYSSEKIYTSDDFVFICCFRRM